MPLSEPTSGPVLAPQKRDVVVIRKLRWALPFLATLLPIILLSFFSYRISSFSITESVEATNLSAVSNLSQLMTQDVLRTLSLAHAVASLPGTTEAIKQRDETSMDNRLKAIVLSYPNINRAYITDKDGVLWSDYPQVPGHYGKHMISEDWFLPALNASKNVVSRVYESPLPVRSLVMAVATPVLSSDGQKLGVLVFEYDLSQVSRWIQSIRVSQSGFLYVVDGEGILAAHPRPVGDIPLDSYAEVAQIARARGGEVLTDEYHDPITGEAMVATFQPLSVGKDTWVIVAQQPVISAFASLERVKVNIGLAGGALTLLTFGMVIALARTTVRAERLNDQLKTAITALQDFASIVSHQLRAPVTSMRWLIESILDGTYGPVPKELEETVLQLQKINAENHVLITDILNMSRIDRGVVTAALAPVSLGDIVQDSAKNYLETARRQSIDLNLEIPQKAIMVLADREKFVEAIGNSISNALKHTGTGRGSITIRARTDGTCGIVEVQDTGEGMTKETLAKLFTRDQILGANVDPEKSTGLGLYIAQNFMRLQKGSISAHSAPGKGSTFIYTIPLAPQAA
jgi:signal transduction histidine kinase